MTRDSLADLTVGMDRMAARERAHTPERVVVVGYGYM